MIPNNNLSVLPWYTSLSQQEARKWWMYGKVYPLFTPAGFILPWQIITAHSNRTVDSISVYLFDANTDMNLGNYSANIRAGIHKKEFTSLGYDVWVFPGTLPVFASLENGRYYLRLSFASALTVYSEVFTVVNDIQPYLKLAWWDREDFTMDAGTIVYRGPQFRNILYLQSDLAKPEYSFEEEGEERDGYFFPVKMISEKKYKFSFLASEYLLDVMRFIRLSDFAQVEYRGQTYTLDTFLLTPRWEDRGDIAVVEAEFDTATVAKKLGVGYIKAQRGDFNDDFNNDFSNQ